jgi:uncharacterized protein (DUF427 family)
MTDHIKLRKANGVWVIRAGGAVLGESRDAVELVEGEMPPVIYFPRTDIAMVFLEHSPTTGYCPYKGPAELFSISVPGGTLFDAAWSYPAPPEALSRIAGYIAFYTDRVAIEQI